MSVERDIIDELDVVLANIRRAEQNIIGKDSSDKLKVVNRLVDLEETVKSIKSEILIPTLDITEDTLIEELQREKLLSGFPNIDIEQIEDIIDVYGMSKPFCPCKRKI